MSEKFKETQIESKLLYEGRIFNLYKDKVLLPNNNYSHREYLVHPKSVVIVPLFSNRDIILIKQYRYSVKDVFIELPAGKVDPGEKIEQAAMRELLEETGYDAQQLKWMNQFYPCAGYSNEEMHLYIAEDLSLKKQALDDDEFVQPMIVSYKEALKLVETGQITDLKTIASIYHIRKYVQTS